MRWLVTTGIFRTSFYMAERASIRLCQIIHNLADVRVTDWRTVNLDHFGYLGPPEVFLEFRTPGLGLDIVDRMARRAVVLHDLQIGARLECRRLARKLVRDRLCARFRRALTASADH